MNNVLEKVAADEVVVKCNGLTCQIGFCVTVAGYAPVVVMFAPGVVTTTKRVYADFLVDFDKAKFEIEELPKVEAEKQDQVETEKQSEPAKNKGLFSKK